MSDSDWETVAVGPDLSASGGDEWETVAVGPDKRKQSYDEEEAGNWLNILNAMTLGFGDEIVGGGNALIDSLMGQDSIGNAYDSRLQQARELRQGFREENPGLSMVQDVGGGAMLPAGKLVSEAKGFVPKVGAAAIEGAGFSGLAGFGNAEGGFQNRLTEAKDTAQTGALLSAALSTPFAAIESLSPSINKAGQAMKRKSLGPTQSDYTRTADQIGTISESGEVGTKTKKALDFILGDPSVKKTTDPVELLTITRGRQTELAKQVRGLVEGVDESRNINIQPSYSRAAEYINKSVPADKVDSYESMLTNFKEAVEGKGKGKLSYLQDQKIALGKLWDPNDTTKNGYIRELYGDVQNAIEQYAPEVKGVNDELSNWMLAEKLFERQIAKSESQSWPEQIRGWIRTSGGFGLPALAAIASGASYGTGAIVGGLGAYATSPGGQRNLGRGLDLLSRTSVPTQVSPLVASLLGSGGDSDNNSLLAALQSLGSNGQYEATREPVQAQTAQDYSPQNQKSELLARSLLEQPGQGIQGSSGTSFKQDLESRLGSPIEYRQSPSPTQGESTDMYNPVKWQGKEVPFENLVQAVVQVESAGNAKAEGPKTKYGTAKGAMQILDSTAKWALEKMGRNPEEWNPYDEQMNKEVGSWYLQYLVEKFEEPRLALAAYNWGEGNLQRLIKKLDTKDFDKLRSHLPKETRLYVPKVEKNLAIEV